MTRVAEGVVERNAEETSKPRPKRRRRLVERTRYNLPVHLVRIQAVTLPIQPRASKEISLSRRLVIHLNDLGSHANWLELWPRCATHYGAAANEAVTALTKALEYNRGRRAAPELAVAALTSEGTAIRLLQTDIEKIQCQAMLDSALISTAALAIFQVVMHDTSKGRRADTFAHWAGMHAIIQARQTDSAESDIVRAILYSFSDGLSGLAVLEGTPLILEQQDWANVKPASLHPMQSDVLRLRTTEYQLQLQLPHLVCKTRMLREKGVNAAQNLGAILGYACGLYQTSEDEAETAILRRATVLKAEKDSIIPVTLKFSTKDDMLVALAYWHSRLVIINCCLRIIQEGHNSRALDRARLKFDRDRILMNILMSWEHAASTDTFVAAMLSKGFTQGWQHLRKAEIWRGLRCHAVIAWMLPRMASPSLAYLETPELTIAQLDLAADMLQGGPLGNFLGSDAL